MRRHRHAKHLSPDEQGALALRAKAGDRAARDRLVLTNQRLVVRLAARLSRPSHLDLDDLVQEGNLGLLRAIEMWDPEGGSSFPTCAWWWIRTFALALLQDQRHVMRVATTETRRIIVQHWNRMAHLPDAEIAQRLKVPEAIVADMRQRLQSAVSISATARRGTTIGELAHPGELPDQAAEREEARRLVRGALGALQGREALIIERRFLAEDPETLAQIGQTLGLHRERIRQIEAVALRRLRQAIEPRRRP